jgi:hypothetical protein
VVVARAHSRLGGGADAAEDLVQAIGYSDDCVEPEVLALPGRFVLVELTDRDLRGEQIAVRQDFKLRLEGSLDETRGSFKGVANIYGDLDLGGDIVDRDAFDKTLKEGQSASRSVQISNGEVGSLG